MISTQDAHSAKTVSDEALEASRAGGLDNKCNGALAVVWTGGLQEAAPRKRIARRASSPPGGCALPGKHF